MLLTPVSMWVPMMFMMLRPRYCLAHAEGVLALWLGVYHAFSELCCVIHCLSALWRKFVIRSLCFVAL